MEFKYEVNEYAEKNSNHKAAKKFMLLLKGLEKRDRTNFYFYENGLILWLLSIVLLIKLLISDGKFTALVFISFLNVASPFSNKEHFNLTFCKASFNLDGWVLETGALSLAGTFKFFCCFVTKLLCF